MKPTIWLSLAIAVISLHLAAQPSDFRAVTEASLRNPPPGDWLNWRRTDDAWGYSPLDQINRQNVHQLQLVWSRAMDDTGAGEATALVHDGIMYLPNPRGVIQALDAATEDLIWEYRPAVAETPALARTGGEQTAIPRLTQAPTRPAGGDSEATRGIQRNIAIFGDRIFGSTNDAHLIALDARTGHLVWDT
jgi:alcohol dehydrogenase (cytochrome c)